MLVLLALVMISLGGVSAGVHYVVGVFSVENSASGEIAGADCFSCHEDGENLYSLICFFRAKYDFDYEEFDSISAQAKVSYSMFCPVIFYY